MITMMRLFELRQTAWEDRRSIFTILNFQFCFLLKRKHCVERSDMSVPRWLSVSLLVAATVPANGNIRAGFSPEILISRNDVAGNVAATESSGGFLFRSTLIDEGDGRPQMSMGRKLSMEKWDALRAPVIPHEDERTTILPEAGSGILLSIGLLGLIGVGRSKNRWSRAAG